MTWRNVCLFLKRIPSLCLEIKLVAVAADELMSLTLGRDVADDLDVLQLAHHFVGREGNGEEQFIVFTAVEGAGGYVHVQFLGHGGSLVVERDALLIHAAAHVALGADVHQFAAQTVAYVHHAGGVDASLAQSGYDVGTCLGLQLALQQVLSSAHVGLEVLQSCHFVLVARFLGLGQLLVIYGSLAFQQL